MDNENYYNYHFFQTMEHKLYYTVSKIYTILARIMEYSSDYQKYEKLNLPNPFRVTIFFFEF